MGGNLRYGVVFDGLERWQLRCLEALDASGAARCVFRFEPPAASAPAHSLFWRFYRDHWSRPRSRRDAPIPAWLHEIPACDLDETAACDLDFLLDLTPHPSRTLPFEGPKHGVWRFQFGSDGADGAWDVGRGEPITFASLMRLAGPDEAIALKQAWFRTVPYSHAGNTDQVLDGTAHWPAEVCTELSNGTADYLDSPGACIELAPERRLGAVDSLRLGLRSLIELLRQIYADCFRHEQWSIASIPRPIESFLEHNHTRDATWKPVLGRNSYLADPFPVVVNGVRYALCERFDHARYRGSIVAISLDDSDAQPVAAEGMPTDSHMSYPSVFTQGDSTYCIPETSESRRLVLYEAIDSPFRWKPVATLLEDVAAADATVCCFEGRFWMFYTDLDRDRYDNLCIRYADRLEGPWTRHAAHPAKIDVRSSRPAGTPFIKDGELYRPAQDCSRTYGGETVINRVRVLTPERFVEEAHVRVQPDPQSRFRHGLHTISSGGEFTLIDGKRYVFSPSAMVRVIVRVLGKRLSRS